MCLAAFHVQVKLIRHLGLSVELLLKNGYFNFFKFCGEKETGTVSPP